MTIKYPEIKVKLIGEDGNAFSILGAVQKELKKAGLHEEANEYYEEATSGDYDNLLSTTMLWVNVY